MGRMRFFAVWGVLALLLISAYGEPDFATDTEREKLAVIMDEQEQTVALDDDVLSDRALTTVTCRYVTFGVTIRRGRVNGALIPYNFNANPQRGTFRFTADEIGGNMEFVLQATNPLFPAKCISVSDSGFLLSCRSSRTSSPWHNFGSSRRLWKGKRVTAVNQTPSGRTPVCATYKTEKSSLDSTFEMEASYFSRAERIWSSDEGNLVNLRAGVGAFQNPNPLPPRKPAIVDEPSLRNRLNSNRGGVDKNWRDDAKVAVHRDTLVVNRLTSTKGFVDIYRRSRSSGWSRVQTIQVPAPYNTVFTRFIGRKILVRWNALVVLGYHRGNQKYWAYMYQRTAFNTPFVFIQRIALRGNQNLKFGAFQPNIALLARWMAAQTSPTVVSIFSRSGNGPSSTWSKVGQIPVRMQHAQPWVLGASTNWLYDWGGSDKMQWNRERELVVANQRNKQVRVFFENAGGSWVQRQAWSNSKLFRTNWALSTYEEFLFCTADDGYGSSSEIVQIFRKNLATNRYRTTPSQTLRQNNRNFNTWRGFGNRMVVEDGVLLVSDYGGFDVTFHVFVLNRDTRQWTFFQRLEKRGSESPVQIQAVGYAHPNYAFAMVDGTPMGWFVPVTPALPCTTPSVDICFAMDRSGSISSRDYQAEKDFITGIVDRFEASPGGQTYRYSAVSFESTVRTISTLITSAGEFSRQVNNHPGPGGCTNMAGAMRSCDGILNSGSGAIQILVLITDGQPCYSSNSELISLAASIKTTKTIISVGAGSGINERVLRSMASKASGTNTPLYVSVSQANRFLDFVPELAEEVCNTF